MTSIVLPLLYLGESSFSFSDTRSPMPPSFLWPKASVVSILENHFSAFEHCPFRHQNHGVMAGIFAAVGDQQFGQLLDVEAMLGNHAAIGGSRHGRQHGGKARIATEDFENQEAFVRTG